MRERKFKIVADYNPKYTNTNMYVYIYIYCKISTMRSSRLWDRFHVITLSVAVRNNPHCRPRLHILVRIPLGNQHINA